MITREQLHHVLTRMGYALVAREQLHHVLTRMGYALVAEEDGIVQYRDPAAPVWSLQFSFRNRNSLPLDDVIKQLEYEGFNADLFWGEYGRPLEWVPNPLCIASPRCAGEGMRFSAAHSRPPPCHSVLNALTSGDGLLIHGLFDTMYPQGSAFNVKPPGRALMVPAIEEHAGDLKRLFVQHRVKQLDLFGSAANASRLNPDKSDLDFLVEFQPSAPPYPIRAFWVSEVSRRSLWPARRFGGICRDKEPVLPRIGRENKGQNL